MLVFISPLNCGDIHVEYFGSGVRAGSTELLRALK